MNAWTPCKNLLIIRPDNMGDLVMTGPAIRALHAEHASSITVLTSSVGAAIAPHLPGVNDVIVADLPWVKNTKAASAQELLRLAETLRERSFDGALVFTVYSQNPLPSAMLAYLAGIPQRAGYCRENPYGLLTHWLPDKEPYGMIRHQVERDLALVRALGLRAQDEQLALELPAGARGRLAAKLSGTALNAGQPFIILHPGVSEKKREYPLPYWIEVAEKLKRVSGLPLVVTGTAGEEHWATAICDAVAGCHSLCGKLDIESFITLIDQAAVVVSVNTGTVHIAAARQRPVVVLYALTNPQHTPWQTPASVLSYSVDKSIRSQNQVVDYVTRQMEDGRACPAPDLVCAEVTRLLQRHMAAPSAVVSPALS